MGRVFDAMRECVGGRGGGRLGRDACMHTAAALAISLSRMWGPQVLRNYHRERERITKESHSEFKVRPQTHTLLSLSHTQQTHTQHTHTQAGAPRGAT